jgi:hypothetical protein
MTDKREEDEERKAQRSTEGSDEQDDTGEQDAHAPLAAPPTEAIILKSSD